jgi:TusA-related sulfurtransferase
MRISGNTEPSYEQMSAGGSKMQGDEQAAKSLDCIGLFCPEPLFQTREAMDGLNVGDVLEVFADDPAAEEDLRRFAKRAGHEIVLIEDQGDHKQFLIRKGR